MSASAPKTGTRIKLADYQGRIGRAMAPPAKASAGTTPSSGRVGPGRAVQALGRLKDGAMNGLETRYAAHLKARQHAGEILWSAFERIKLKLADNTFYTADFFVMSADRGLEVHETKGFWEEDARVKIKVAADQFPFRFYGIKQQSKKDGGGFAVEEF